MKEVLTILLFLTSVPVGIILAWITRDELREGRYYFKIIMMSSLGLMFFFVLFSQMLGISLEIELAAVFSLAYLFSISIISLYYNKLKYRKI